MTTLAVENDRWSHGIRHAYGAALNSSHRYRLGAAIMRRTSLVSRGVNSYKTHTKSGHPYKTLHAETAAIHKANAADLDGCTLYVVRVLRAGDLAVSKPCESCEAAIFNSGIKRIVYINHDGSVSTLTKE